MHLVFIPEAYLTAELRDRCPLIIDLGLLAATGRSSSYNYKIEKNLDAAVPDPGDGYHYSVGAVVNDWLVKLCQQWQNGNHSHGLPSSAALEAAGRDGVRLPKEPEPTPEPQTLHDVPSIPKHHLEIRYKVEGRAENDDGTMPFNWDSVSWIGHYSDSEKAFKVVKDFEAANLKSDLEYPNVKRRKLEYRVVGHPYLILETSDGSTEKSDSGSSKQVQG